MATLVEQVGAELAAIEPIITPQIAGVKRLLAVSDDPVVVTAAQAVLDQLIRRQSLIEAMTNARQNLLADGYPALPPLLIPSSVLQALDAVIATYRAERDRGLAEFAAATKHFGPLPQATDLGLTAGAITPKP